MLFRRFWKKLAPDYKKLRINGDPKINSSQNLGLVKTLMFHILQIERERISTDWQIPSTDHRNYNFPSICIIQYLSASTNLHCEYFQSVSCDSCRSRPHANIHIYSWWRCVASSAHGISMQTPPNEPLVNHLSTRHRT